MLKYFILTIAFTLFLVSCGNNENHTPETQGNNQSADPHSGTMSGQGGLQDLTDNNQSNQDFSKATVNISGIELTTPDTWQREAPSSSMRVLQYALKSDNSLKVTGFFFGEQDLIKENIDRWKNEFVKITNEKEEKLNNNITFLTLDGTYKVKPFPMAEENTPTDGYMVIAAIMPSPEGPYYFKIYGPKDKLAAEISSFKKFLASYKKI
ncbi:MAG TPA: hypothetical protein PLE30_10405 [Candidatus Kapabacteria bacterium]|nr:hypothetical protein [Candidatus Kapabacteria bacterium]